MTIIASQIDFNFVILFFFLISILYSSVGFGGGSSYLAVLALTTLPFLEIKTASLACNIVVVSGNVYFYNKNKLIDWKKILPLTALSVPMAYLGGYLKISEKLFFIFLGLTLLLAALTMWFAPKKTELENTFITIKNKVIKDTILGGIIGFISGLVGIGGGIFLAPTLHIFKWDVPKKIAATSSFFILVNSVSGLLGVSQKLTSDFDYQKLIFLIIVVLIGGQIGARLSYKFLNQEQLKKVTAVLIAFVSIKILIKYIY